MDVKGLYLKKLVPPHLLTNFEIQTYYQNEARFNGAYSRNNLLDKIKDGPYEINLHEYLNWNSLDSIICKYQNCDIL